MRTWRRKHPEIAKEKDRIYYQTHKDAVRARADAWRLANPDRIAERRANRRAQLQSSGKRLSRGLVKKLHALQKGMCACCGRPLGDDYHVDHIMPLALGGANEDANIQLLRAECNNLKRAKHPIDFMQKERGMLL